MNMVAAPAGFCSAAQLQLLDRKWTEAEFMMKAQSAQDVLASLNLALQGPDGARMPDALNDAGMAVEEIAAGTAEQERGFGCIEKSYLPPIVWPATFGSNGTGQSYSNFSQSVASELQRMNGRSGRAGHMDRDMEQVQKQAGPSQLVENIAAAGLVIVFGCVAIFAGKNAFVSARHQRTQKQWS